MLGLQNHDLTKVLGTAIIVIADNVGFPARGYGVHKNMKDRRNHSLLDAVPSADAQPEILP